MEIHWNELSGASRPWSIHEDIKRKRKTRECVEYDISLEFEDGTTYLASASITGDPEEVEVSSHDDVSCTGLGYVLYTSDSVPISTTQETSSGYAEIITYDITDGLQNNITLAVDAVYNQTKLKLKWFVDGIEQPEHENKLSVTFDRPSTNSWVSYSYQVEDLTGNLIAPNDPLSPVDFYEGNFERYYYYEPNPELTPINSLMPYIGSFRWYDPNSGWSTDESVNSSNMDNYLFALSCCSMGSTFKINWANYQQTSGQMSSSNGVKKYFFERPNSNSNQKIFNLNLSKDTVEVISTTIERPNPELIREPVMTKSDIYGLEFYNTENELVYKVGIGDPFMVRLQHIDMLDEEHYTFEVPISNFNVVIPRTINPSYVSLIRRNNQNIYSEVSRYILN